MEKGCLKPKDEPSGMYSYIQQGAILFEADLCVTRKTCVCIVCLAYADTIPNISNIANITHMLTNIGHPFGHQPGLDESSIQNSADILKDLLFRFSLCFHSYA